MSRRAFRIALTIVVGVVVVLGIAAAVIAYLASEYPETAREGAGVFVEVEIRPGTPFPDIAKMLQGERVIDDARAFRLYAMHRGATTEIRAGKYRLRDDLTPKQVLDQLVAGVDEESARVTIPEGKNILEVFAIIESAGVAKAAELEALARDPAFLKEHDIPGETLEGYLFPDTYRFKVPTPPERVLGTMLRQFKTVWSRVRSDHKAGVEEMKRRLGWSEHEILVLASIIEKEAVRDDERARISQVFVNRLLSPSFRPKLLQTDPTIRYGCSVPVEKSQACREWDPGGRLRTAQLRDRDNPYNTYQHQGLPPGPIANPGESSLVAALEPDGSDYFYFVARDDGSHVFSRTIAEHRRNVDKYQR